MFISIPDLHYHGAKEVLQKDHASRRRLLRLFNDLSYDMRFIDEKRYQLISERLNEIGRLLGGWIKSQKETNTTNGK